MPSIADKRKYLQPEMVVMLNTMALRARMVVEGYIIGQHRSPYHGFSVEFAEHRAYGPGDEIRHIDWKLYGKTDRLYVKRYEEETNLRAHLILDTSRSMAYTSGSVSKLQYSSFLLAALSYPILGAKAVTSISELSRRYLILFLSALIPLIQYKLKVFTESLIIFMDCKILWMIKGLKTFNSK